MQKAIKYIGKYDKLSYKGYTFIKNIPQLIDEEVAELIMAKGYMSTQFILVTDDIQDGVIGDVPDDAKDGVQDDDSLQENTQNFLSDVSDKKSKKKRGSSDNESTYTYMQNVGDGDASDY